MTLPDERYFAVVSAESLLLDLLDPKQTPRVPKSIRQRARSVLRHFPTVADLDMASESCPSIFNRRLDPLHKMILSYEQDKEKP